MIGKNFIFDTNKKTLIFTNKNTKNIITKHTKY